LKSKSKVVNSSSQVVSKDSRIYLMYMLFRYYLNLYIKYKRFGLLGNRLVTSLILKRFFVYMKKVGIVVVIA